MQVLSLGSVSAHHPPVCPALHEVHLPEASPIPPLPAGHEAAQLRAQGQHDLVQQTNSQVITGRLTPPACRHRQLRH